MRRRRTASQASSSATTTARTSALTEPSVSRGPTRGMGRRARRSIRGARQASPRRGRTSTTRAPLRSATPTSSSRPSRSNLEAGTERAPPGALSAFNPRRSGPRLRVSGDLDDRAVEPDRGRSFAELALLLELVDLCVARDQGRLRARFPRQNRLLPDRRVACFARLRAEDGELPGCCLALDEIHLRR